MPNPLSDALPLERLLARAEALISRATVTGRRYNAQAESEVDTEEF